VIEKDKTMKQIIFLTRVNQRIIQEKVWPALEEDWCSVVGCGCARESKNGEASFAKVIANIQIGVQCGRGVKDCEKEWDCMDCTH
jgi:hypothetical protein